MLKGSIDLLAQASSRRLMLGRILVELLHILVELVDLLLIAILADEVRLAQAWAAAFLSRRWTILLELFDLFLHLCNAFLKLLVAENATTHLDIELCVQTHVDRLGLLGFVSRDFRCRFRLLLGQRAATSAGAGFEASRSTKARYLLWW